MVTRSNFSLCFLLLSTCWWLLAIVAAVTDASNGGDDSSQECTISESDGSTTCSYSPADDDIDINIDVDCGIYMAPSTLGAKTNLGMFTGTALPKGRILDYPEIAIPFLFREWANHPSHAFGDGQLWDRYIWEGEVADLEVVDALEQFQRPSVFVPGLGCTVNSLLELNNIRSTRGSIYDTTGVSRSHPAAGSFTPYHHAITKTVRSIPAGSELFASYGDNWIPWIKDVAVTQTKNLLDANEFLQEYKEFVTGLKEEYGDKVDAALLDRLWKLTRNFPHTSRKAFSVLPYELDHEAWLEALEASSSSSSSSEEEPKLDIPDTRDYWRDRGVVDLDWLKQHGKCQDHLKPGISTIPNAGRGAFAARDLPKGTVVGYAPLVHIGERVEEALTIHYNGTTYSSSSSSDDDDNDSDNKKYNKLDLIINYSFGHKDSTLILTPYGAMVNYINHASDPTKVNVRVQWPKNELVAHKPEWLDKNLEFLRDTSHKVGLSFDYIALRDIEEGEEIFMDYGDEWQEAWDEHVQHWQPPMDADRYMHSTEYARNSINTDYDDDDEDDEYDYDDDDDDDDNEDAEIPLKIPSERLANPYPPNLQTLCRESYTTNPSKPGSFVFVPVLRKDHTRVHCEVLERKTATRNQNFQYGNNDNKKHYLYTVQMILTTTTTKGEEQKVIVEDVPYQHGIELSDKVYSQDWHLPQAFRHKMYVPDDLFPESWKNLKEGYKKSNQK